MVALSQLFIMCLPTHSARAPWLVWRLVQSLALHQNEIARFTCTLRAKQCYSHPWDSSSSLFTSLYVLQVKLQFMGSILWEEFEDRSALTRKKAKTTQKGQTKRYLSICRSNAIASQAIEKAGGEIADGLQSYCNVLSLHHHMATICRLIKLSFLLPLYVQSHHHCSIGNTVFL